MVNNLFLEYLVQVYVEDYESHLKAGVSSAAPDLSTFFFRIQLVTPSW